MKKILVIVCVALLAVCALPKGAAAQDKKPQHISFAGFPVDRTNVQFKINLMARGFRWLEYASAQTPGTDVFIGTFTGKGQTFIHSMYDSKSKAVYKIKVVFKGTSLDEANKLKMEMRNRLYEKYVNTLSSKYEDEIHQGTQFYRFTLYRDNSDPQFAKGPDLLGYILLYVVKDTTWEEFEEPGEEPSYNVILEYIDFIHWDEHNRNLNSEQL